MNPLRKTLLGAAVVGATLTGGAVGVAFFGASANAQTTGTSDTSGSSSASASASSGSTATQTPAAPAAPAGAPNANGQRPGGPRGNGQFDPSKGGHVANGITEALLTGDTADKVTAAAKAAVPDGTIQRVENDAEGAVYEAHMTKADGTQVTVKLGADFAVTSVENGMG